MKVWHILCLSFTVGMAQAFGGPAYQALIPSLVEQEDLPNAIALNSIQFNLARVIGPALGGIALTQLGAAWCFGLNGLSFVAVIISLYAIRLRFIPGKTKDTMLASLKQGIGFLWHQGAMRSLVALAFLMTLLGIPMLVFLPVFAKDVFHAGPTTYTLLLVASGAGAISGALTVAAFGNRRNKGRDALLLLVLLGVLMACFALARSLALSTVFLFLAGGVLIAAFAPISSLVQLIITDEMRGRVMSVYNVAFRGGMPIGSLATGALVPHVHGAEGPGRQWRAAVRPGHLFPHDGTEGGEALSYNEPVGEASVRREKHPKWMTRIVEGGFPDRSFDITFWQEQGDEAIFRAAWEMVELAEEVKHGRKPTLQRTATSLKRM